MTETPAGAAINEIALRLAHETAIDSGAHFIGASSKSGTPYSLPAERVNNQIAALLAHLNAHANLIASAHPSSAINSSAINGSPHALVAGTVLQQLTSLLASLNAVASELAAHQHDEHYLRQIFTDSQRFEAGELKQVTTLPDKPDLVAVSYNLYSGSQIASMTMIQGTANDLVYWVNKVDSGGGDKDFEVWVLNSLSQPAYVHTQAYGRSL